MDGEVYYELNRNMFLAGDRIHNPLTLTKFIDMATPKLYQALANRERFVNFELRFYAISEEGGEIHLFTIELEDAVIILIQMGSASGEASGDVEAVSFIYDGITWTWEPEGISFSDTTRGRI